MLGVADGVGSWSSDGIDPAAYAAGLMEAACQVCRWGGGWREGVLRGRGGGEVVLGPLGVLRGRGAEGAGC
jgi:hypothetical protein